MLREDYKEYMDSRGWVSSSLHPEDYDGLNIQRFTSEYYIALQQNNLLSISDEYKFDDLFMSCEMSNGLLQRHPRATDQNSVDNYIAICAASYMSGDNFAAHSIHEYGKKNWYCYNNVEPGKKTLKSFLGRNLAFIAHVKFCAEEYVNPFLLLAWCISVGLTFMNKKDKQDSRALSYLLVLPAEKQSFICRLVSKYFRKKLREEGGLPKILGEYFNNPDHPNCKWYAQETK